MAIENQAVEDAPVFILGSGRCGSTWLQSIINSNPDFLIWGEHAGFLSHFARAYHLMATTPLRINMVSSGNFEFDAQRLRDVNEWNGFVNPFDFKLFGSKMREFLHSLFADPGNPSIRWGFKEIRYSSTDRDFTAYFLRSCFPRAQFLILIRNPVDTIFGILSAWHRDIGNNVMELDRKLFEVTREWAKMYERLFLFKETSSSNAAVIKFEDFSQAEFDRVAEFLKATRPFDYQRASVSNKEPTIKDDTFAELIRARTRLHHRRLNQITHQARLLYGYSEAWNSD